MLGCFQEKVFNELYKFLVNEKKQIIFLSGENGCGKTETLLSLSELFDEDWKLFYIKGLSKEDPPYTAWVAEHEIIIHERKVSPSIGLSKIPLSNFATTATVSLGYQKNIAKDISFTENEMRIFQSLIKDAKGNENILIIADDYELWDASSKSFLEKLMRRNLKIGNKLFHIIVVTNEKNNLLNVAYIEMKEPSDVDYCKILNSKYSGDINVKEIKDIAGNNFNIAFMLVEYMSNNKKAQLYEIIEYLIRSSDIIKSSDLEKMSIINGKFSINETSFLLERTPLDSERILKDAKQKHFIDGNIKYYFKDEKIQKYFLSKILDQKKYLHNNFATYLQNNYPEDYYNRFYHLKLGYEAEGEINLRDALQLLLIEYARRRVLVHDKQEIKNLLDIYDATIACFQSNQREEQESIKTIFLSGLYHYLQFCYNEAFATLSTLMKYSLCSAFESEVQRMLLLCHLQLGNNIEVLVLANSLYKKIKSQEFIEDEQICKNSLVLLAVYIDKHEDEDKADNVLTIFNATISKHNSKERYWEMRASLNKKASLYYPPSVAVNHIDESISFYRQSVQPVNLFLSLCNSAANHMLNLDLKRATEEINECKEMINEKYFVFPSTYKVYNNEQIIKYLSAEKKYLEKELSKKAFMEELETIYKKLTSIKEMQANETSYVIELNRLSIAFLLSKDTFIEEFEELGYDLKHADSYYQFYYLDLSFAHAIIQKNYEKARSILNDIEILRPTLLKMYNNIFQSRMKIQNKLIQSKFDGSILDYHFYFLKNSTKVQDYSFYFYMRGLLVSDLQYLSF